MHNALYKSTTSTTPPRLYDVCSCWSKMSWSILSKAAYRSSSVKTARLPVSRASKMSAGTLSTAVSVKWCDLYADWRSGWRLLSLKYVTNCLATSLSSSLDSTDKLQIGRYDLCYHWPQSTKGLKTLSVIVNLTFRPMANDSSVLNLVSVAWLIIVQKDKTNEQTASTVRGGILLNLKSHEICQEWLSIYTTMLKISTDFRGFARKSCWIGRI